MSRMRWVTRLYPVFLRRLAADRSGVSAVITAIALTTLAGFGGLAVDVVMWEVNQRAMQGAADQAALAAATAFRNAGQSAALGDSTTAQNAAYATAIRNGYPSGSVTVAAYNNGGTCTNDGCIKVSISQQQPRYFTGVFTSSNFTESASAVATCGGCGTGTFKSTTTLAAVPCVMALDGGGKGVITDTGGSSLSLKGCNLYNNAPNTDATIVNNNAVIEGCSTTNACGSQAFLAQPNNPGGIDVPVVTNASPAPDPFAGISPPTVASTCTSSFSAYADPNHANTYVNVPSGTYCPGNINGDTITFATGAIIVINQNNGLDTHGNGNTVLSGTGVLLYILGGGNINANTVLNLTASTTGQYSGLTLWFGDTNNVSYAGSNSGTFQGAIYAPKADVSYAGNGGSTSSCTRLIAGSIDLSGGSMANFDNTGCPALTASGAVLTASGLSGTTPPDGAPVLVQ